MERMTNQRICVYCGSSSGVRTEYAAAARLLGAEVARRGWELVYGGGNVGLMGVVADAALAAGGHVIGVIPEGLLAREVGHRGLPDLRVVAGMHERKAMMAGLAGAFVALPGGFGTMEELCEVLTWTQLGLLHRPIGLLNTAGFYSPLLAFFDHMTTEGLLRREHRDLLLCHAEPEALLDAVMVAPAPRVEEWG